MIGSRQLDPPISQTAAMCPGPEATAAGPCYFSSCCLFHDRKGSGEGGGGSDVCQVTVPTLMCTELEIVGGTPFVRGSFVSGGTHTEAFAITQSTWWRNEAHMTDHNTPILRLSQLYLAMSLLIFSRCHRSPLLPVMFWVFFKKKSLYID